MMVALLMYSYCFGLLISRKIVKACMEDAAFRVLIGNLKTDHSRISDLRRRHLDVLAGLFVQVLWLCQEADLESLGQMDLDGTKVKANASKHKAKPLASANELSHERFIKSERQLEGEMRALLRKPNPRPCLQVKPSINCRAASAPSGKGLGEQRSPRDLAAAAFRKVSCPGTLTQ
jgi:hypothetical protein